MEWIKRNILFVAGSAIALVLMGLAAFYLISSSRKNDEALEKLNAEYALLERLSNQNPHPGDDKTDNIAAARKQKKQVDQFIRQAAKVFQPIDPIPSGTNLNNAMFARALRKTIDQMQAEATKRGVQVPTNFYFSFTAVRDRIMFDKAGLDPLAMQLGDVKAICDVLIEARVNALDAVRREKVSVHDAEAQQTTDYLTAASTTNEIAIVSPYEISFRCFSSELAAVLAGYASSPHGLIVRAMNVEPATMAGSMSPGMDGMDGFMPYMPAPVPQVYPEESPYAPPVQGNRYTQGYPPGGMADPESLPRGYAPGYPGTAVPYARGRTTAGTRGGLPTMLDEKQIKVTMQVQVVKLTLNK